MPAGDCDRYFDLNIEKILEGWETRHAIREVIANGLDEQVLTATAEIEIMKDQFNAWHVRDFGRGLKCEHLTENENKEKLENAGRVIGKFGVGLKDALATLFRRGVGVRIRSRHGDITLAQTVKHGFGDIATLHAVITLPADPQFAGTDFVLTGVSDSEIKAAKDFFLKFSNEEVLDETPYGQILRGDPKRNARVYVTGMLIAEEERFALSYNITSLTATMRRALNRERSNVGRGAYTDRVKAMLLDSKSKVVAEILAEELTRIELGTNHDEVAWADVALHASQILNATEKVVFVTATERTVSADSVGHAISDGFEVVTVPENIKKRLENAQDVQGNPVRDLQTYQREWTQSFEFKFVPESSLTPSEKTIYAARDPIVQLAGGMSSKAKDIKISETMRPDLSTGRDAVGLWDAGKQIIVIKRSQLRSLEAFAGTLLHEITHACTGHRDDVTRDFEDGLTEMLGKVSIRALTLPSTLYPVAVTPEAPEVESIQAADQERQGKEDWKHDICLIVAALKPHIEQIAKELQVGYWIDDISVALVKLRKWREARCWLELFFSLDPRYQGRLAEDEKERMVERLARCNAHLEPVKKYFL